MISTYLTTATKTVAPLKRRYGTVYVYNGVITTTADPVAPLKQFVSICAVLSSHVTTTAKAVAPLKLRLRQRGDVLNLNNPS